MKQSDFVQKCITIQKSQEEFLAGEKKFSLSKFVQSKLADYITLRKEYREFMKDEKEEKDDEKKVE